MQIMCLYWLCLREANRNEKFHNPKKQRQHVIERTKAMEELILNSNKDCVIKYLRSQEVNVQETSTKTCRGKISIY